MKFLETPSIADKILTLDPSSPGKNDQPKKRNSPIRPEDATLSIVKLKLERFKMPRDLPFHRPQESLVFVKNDEIIHVADVVSATQLLLNEVVQSVQIDVRKKLRRQISNRDPYSD